MYLKTTQLQRHASNENRKLIHKSNREWKTMKAITAKLKDNNAVATPADKGNTIVILPSAVYQEKIQNFIDNNNFRTSKSDPTNTCQKQIRNTFKNSPKLINSNKKWKYVNINPTPLPSGA
jgi:hypothetical protein